MASPSSSASVIAMSVIDRRDALHHLSSPSSSSSVILSEAKNLHL
jgi:hypothetical protein